MTATLKNAISNGYSLDELWRMYDEDEHLQSYIDEALYRWNTRKASQSERFSDMFNKSIGLIVTWRELKLCQVA